MIPPNDCVELLGRRRQVGRGHHGAAHGQIECEERELRPVGTQQRSRRCAREVVTDVPGRGVRLKAAGVAQPIQGELGRDSCIADERDPALLLVDREVGIAWSLRRLDRCVDPALEQASEHKIPEDLELVLAQRVLGVEAAGDLDQGLDPVVGIEHVVGRGDRDIGDENRMHHVAEVEQPAHPREARERVAGIARVYDDVVVVGVPVDDCVTQRREARYDVGREPVVNPVEESQPHRVGHRCAAAGHDRGKSEDVPVEVAMGARVVPSVESRRQPPQDHAEITKQSGRGSLDLGEQGPRQVVEQPHEVPVDARDQITVRSRVHMLHGYAGRARQGGRLGLGLEDLAVLERVGHLEHPPSPVGGLDAEGLVTLAGQARRLHLEAVDLAQDSLCVSRGRRRGVLEQRHGGHPNDGPRTQARRLSPVTTGTIRQLTGKPSLHRRRIDP